mmetsp:Transcript_825/g.1484  ORF Transcript_825/g.1484 Transcript_825/m.1484 type:complete len:118 (-) Transcript_825:558-911(-)
MDLCTTTGNNTQMPRTSPVNVTPRGVFGTHCYKDDSKAIQFCLPCVLWDTLGKQRMVILKMRTQTIVFSDIVIADDIAHPAPRRRQRWISTIDSATLHFSCCHTENWRQGWHCHSTA